MNLPTSSFLIVKISQRFVVNLFLLFGMMENFKLIFAL